MNNTNIIIVNDFSSINGGAAKVAIISAIELSNKGYDVTFFSAVGPICDELKTSKVKVICLGQKDILNDNNRIRAMINGIWNKETEKEIKKLLINYDRKNTIIHIHGYIKALTCSIIKTIIDEKFKIVLTLHDYFTACPNGGFFNYNKNEICHLRSMSKKCILCNCDSRRYVHKIWRLLRQNKQIKQGLLPSGIKNYIYISELSKKVLEPYLPKNASLYYVKNPVDIEKSIPVDVASNKTFVYIGRLSKEKGCTLFAIAAKELGIEATFIGDGELKDEIKRIYPKANLIGWVDKQRINEELNKARALVFPSLWYETLGLTAIEAQAKGVPVIVSDTCTAREVVKNEESGLWFKRNDKGDLNQKIKMLMNDDIARNYGKNAYENYWQNDYSLENHVNELEKVYEHILERG